MDLNQEIRNVEDAIQRLVGRLELLRAIRDNGFAIVKTDPDTGQPVTTGDDPDKEPK